MGKLLNVLLQKVMPGTLKSHLIKFRKSNGAWTEFMLAPNRKEFKVKGSDTVYYLKGVPDINDSTNQREWCFLYGIPHPIKFHSEHPSLIDIEKNKGNMVMQLTEADQQGYERASLINANKKADLVFWILIIVALNLMATLFMGWTIMDKLGIKFW